MFYVSKGFIDLAIKYNVSHEDEDDQLLKAVPWSVSEPLRKIQILCFESKVEELI